MRELSELSNSSDDSWVWYAAARASTLSPQSPADPEDVVRWSKQAAEADPQAWRRHVEGLAEYRAGNLDRAVEILEKVILESNWHEELNQMGLCLANIERGDLVAARKYRSRVDDWIRRSAPARARGEGRETCTDWVELQVLLREVNERLGATEVESNH